MSKHPELFPREKQKQKTHLYTQMCCDLLKQVTTVQTAISFSCFTRGHNLKGY